MDEVFRKINDLALQSGRALQSPETGLIHYFYQKLEGPYQAVPIYENFLFALALCKVKSVESVQEAKVLLDKLLSYQQKGLFPVYLHDFPNCYDKYIGAELLPPLYWLYHYFHLPLGKEMAEKLLSAINRLAEASLEEAPKVPFPKRIKLIGALSALGKDVAFECETLPPIPSQIADCLTGAFLAGPAHAEPFMEKALSHWNPHLQCYMGPFEKVRFTKGKQELTLLDMYMSAYTHELSPRLQGNHPLFLQGALIFPSHWECKKPESPQKWASSFNPKGEYPFIFQWGTSSDLSLLALSAPRAKNIASRGNCKTTVPQKIDDFGANSQGQLEALRRADEALPRRASEEARRELASKGRFYEAHEFCNCLSNEKSFSVDLGAPPNLELKEEGKEVIFYVPLEMKILVNGLLATTFRAGDLISIEDDKIRFELKFQADGGVFQGHLSRGCLPTELYHSGSYRFEAYQWQLAWRTIDRKDGCTLKIDFEYAAKS
jgi:hypothetical protein